MVLPAALAPRVGREKEKRQTAPTTDQRPSFDGAGPKLAILHSCVVVEPSTIR